MYVSIMFAVVSSMNNTTNLPSNDLYQQVKCLKIIGDTLLDIRRSWAKVSMKVITLGTMKHFLT